MLIPFMLISTFWYKHYYIFFSIANDQIIYEVNFMPYRSKRIKKKTRTTNKRESKVQIMVIFNEINKIPDI